VVKAQIWSEENHGPMWARVTVRRVWRYRVAGRHGTWQGITLSWTDAMAAVGRHLKGVS
jgi:hypothetical protein